MAGYVVQNRTYKGVTSRETRQSTLFHIGDPDIVSHILRAADSRVITLQLDCDELSAALWGLANYQKP